MHKKANFDLIPFPSEFTTRAYTSTRNRIRKNNWKQGVRGPRVRSLLSVFMKLKPSIPPSYNYTLLERFHASMLSALLPATSPIWNLILSLPLSSRICFILGTLICLPDLIFPALHITPSRTTLLVSRENSIYKKKPSSIVLLHPIPNQVVLDLDL